MIIGEAIEAPQEPSVKLKKDAIISYQTLIQAQIPSLDLFSKNSSIL